MSLKIEELNYALKVIGSSGSPFFKSFLLRLNEYLGDELNICFRIFNPKKSKFENLEGIDKHTVLILWGDERSIYMPKKYHSIARSIVKCHLPPSWMNKGFIPITDAAFAIPSKEQLDKLKPCSERPYQVFYSGNLNYRRLDLYRGLSERSFGYPFRILACYPINGRQPLLHKIQAIALSKIILRGSKKMDFSNLFPNSYIAFTNGFGKGLGKDEYIERLINSKISICPPGFMTNETIRLLESCLCGNAVICGKLPKLPMYEGHPFVEINDWRRIKWIIDDLLADASRLDEIGHACKNWYYSHFSPEAQAKRIAISILNGNSHQLL